MNRLYSVIADVAVDPFEDIKDFKFYDEVRYPAENPLTLPLVIVLILLLIGAVTVLIILAVKLSKVNRELRALKAGPVAGAQQFYPGAPQQPYSGAQQPYPGAPPRPQQNAAGGQPVMPPQPATPAVAAPAHEQSEVEKPENNEESRTDA
jgi:uncharacterized membrane protein